MISPTELDRTHDPAAKSWVESANAPGCGFPVQNLPYASFSRAGTQEPRRIGVGIGEFILDVSAIAGGISDPSARQAADACAAPVLNDLMRCGPESWSALRKALFDLLSHAEHRGRVGGFLIRQSEAEFRVPVDIPNFTDFFASVHHATNAGRLFRPDNPLLPNYKFVPVAYHSRRSSIDVGGDIVRPWGQIRPDPERGPDYCPCRQLDYEMELGFYIGTPSSRGAPVPVRTADAYLFGGSLLNDWSARDVQAWEYQPLGPFLAKNFATSIAPWVVTMEALRPFRVGAARRAQGDPQPLPHLFDARDQAEGGLDITVEVYLQSAKMHRSGQGAVRLGQGNFATTYWTLAQMIAHHTSNGCNLEAGDLIGSGTISGPTPDSYGSLLELTAKGARPIQLPSGEQRGFLEDGDTVTLRGFGEYASGIRIGFGEVAGRVVAREDRAAAS